MPLNSKSSLAIFKNNEIKLCFRKNGIIIKETFKTHIEILISLLLIYSK